MENLDPNEKKKVIQTVTRFPGALNWQLPIYKNDPEVVLAAITQIVDTLAYASFKLRSNKEFMKQAIKINSKAVNFITDNKEFKNERDIILSALNSNEQTIIEKGCNWLLASEFIKNDKELIVTAIANNGLMLKKADKEYRRDKQIVLLAIKNNVEAVNFMDETFFDNEEVMLSMIKISSTNKSHLNKISLRLRNDKSFLLNAVKEGGGLFSILSEDFKSDREIVIASFMSNAHTLRFVSDNLRNDKDIVLQAVTNESASLQYASKELRNDPEVVLAATLKNTVFNHFTDINEITLSSYASDEIKETIGKGDPVSTLESLILYNKLNNNIEYKEEIKKTKLKI